MDHSPETSENETDEYVYSFHVIAFLDLLGQQERLKEIEGILLEDNRDEKKLLQVLKQTVGTVRRFRSTFTEFYDQYTNLPTSLNVPAEFESHFNQMRRSQIAFYGISDSTITWSSLHAKTEFEYARFLNSISGILAATGMIAPLFLSKGHPFRGGIEIEGGILIRPGSNEIYGPALSRAYKLECEIAQYPRVVIGPGLIDFLSEIPKMEFLDSRIKRYCDLMARRCNDWITIAEDGQAMIHFLGPQAMALHEGSLKPNYHQEFLIPSHMFVYSQEKKYRDEGNTKIAQRYRELRRYFDKYLDSWTKN